jgi:hypothetical protein
VVGGDAIESGKAELINYDEVGAQDAVNRLPTVLSARPR